MKIDISHLAKLAKLTISPAEEKKYSQQLERIIEYIDQLRQIDTSQIKPTLETINLKNISFDEKKLPKQKAITLKNLKAKRYFTVKRIL